MLHTITLQTSSSSAASVHVRCTVLCNGHCPLVSVRTPAWWLWDMSVALLCDRASSHASVKCSCVQPLPYHIRLLHTHCRHLVLWIQSMWAIVNTGILVLLLWSRRGVCVEKKKVVVLYAVMIPSILISLVAFPSFLFLVPFPPGIIHT